MERGRRQGFVEVCPGTDLRLNGEGERTGLSSEREGKDRFSQPLRNLGQRIGRFGRCPPQTDRVEGIAEVFTCRENGFERLPREAEFLLRVANFQFRFLAISGATCVVW
jgi:hypothetical protein